ncbi:hypothetical protein MKW92_002935 [Papaver armeniacum]|nr:hypothetical protein MKW92_002935 [Papaver armeniacum]
MNPQGSSKLAVVILTLVLVAATTSSRTTDKTEETLKYSFSSIHNFIGVNKVDDRNSNLLQDDQSSSKDLQMGATACCDECICTRSNPPKCQCDDIKPQCHANCKLCRCTRSQPPQCRCMDVTSFCYPECSSSSVTISDE